MAAPRHGAEAATCPTTGGVPPHRWGLLRLYGSPHRPTSELDVAVVVAEVRSDQLPQCNGTPCVSIDADRIPAPAAYTGTLGVSGSMPVTERLQVLLQARCGGGSSIP